MFQAIIRWKIINLICGWQSWLPKSGVAPRQTEHFFRGVGAWLKKRTNVSRRGNFQGEIGTDLAAPCSNILFGILHAIFTGIASQ